MYKNRRVIDKIIINILSLLMIFTTLMGQFAGSYYLANENDETPPIVLNGTVEEGAEGALDSKSAIVSSNRDSVVNFRLVPGYSTGRASGVRVYISLPSLEYIEGDYKLTQPDQDPSPLGIKGTVSAGGGWNVIGDTTSYGGTLVMEYDGDLVAGSNPAFDILVSTYSDGTDGPYGGVPEGTAFEINGNVMYEEFNRVEGSSWVTSGGIDDESRVALISSDLEWEISLESSLEDGELESVPIWDRYQYVDYDYTLKNSSENTASNIDGYTVTFDIDSSDSNINGIIPFDINRWLYNDGNPVANEDIDNNDMFVGVPGKGGVLIYDITDWDGEEKLTNAIPYTYSGSGLIMIDKQTGDNKEGLTPEGVEGSSEKVYRISIPLSRQGFPDIPSKFKVKAITNVLFAKTANWSKTIVKEREIVLPDYDMDFDYSSEKAEVVFGYETFFETSEIVNKSNVDVYDIKINHILDKEYIADRIEIKVPKSFEEDKLEDFLTGVVEYTTKDTVNKLNGVLVETAEDEEYNIVSVDISSLEEIEGWDRNLTINYTDKVIKAKNIDEPSEYLVSSRIYGKPNVVGVIKSTANLVFVEKIASNDDFGQDTSYTDIEHTVSKEAEFTTIYPDEVVPKSNIYINNVLGKNTVELKERVHLSFRFGTGGLEADSSTFSAIINSNDEVLSETKLIVNEELFNSAKNIKLSITTKDDEVIIIDLDDFVGPGNFEIDLSKYAIKSFLIETDSIMIDDVSELITLSGLIDNGLIEQHEVNSTFKIYQRAPYDKTSTVNSKGIITIILPTKLDPVISVIGKYNEQSSLGTTTIPLWSNVDMDFTINTKGKISPSSTYTISLDKPR